MRAGKRLIEGIVLLAAGCIPAVMSSSTLPLGSVTKILSISCPAGFFSGMTCFTANVSCPGTADIQVSFGHATPANVKGTIFLHGGSGGTTPFDYGPSAAQTYPKGYFAAGFRIVQLAWATDWEDTGLNPRNIKSAACRPATLAKHVFTRIHGGPSSNGAMCTHGHSGGSGAMAYAIAYYGASDYLDKVELTSGPVFGDIEAGCKVPNVPRITICGPEQYGCRGLAWMDFPQYGKQSVNSIDRWTGDATCNATHGDKTSPASNAAWKGMSVVDGSDGGLFSYPKTAISGWLCSNAQNNSAAQGNYFYGQIKNASQTAAYSLHRIDNCPAAEDIWNGTDVMGASGFTASVNAMVSGCVRRH
jgi:hypothetical protein